MKNATVPCAFYIAYLLVGALQLIAILSAFWMWCADWHWFFKYFALLVGFAVSYIPIVGPIVGVFCAISAWGWSPFWAILLNFPGFVMPLLAVFFSDKKEKND